MTTHIPEDNTKETLHFPTRRETIATEDVLECFDLIMKLKEYAPVLQSYIITFQKKKGQPQSIQDHQKYSELIEKFTFFQKMTNNDREAYRAYVPCGKDLKILRLVFSQIKAASESRSQIPV